MSRTVTAKRALLSVAALLIAAAAAEAQSISLGTGANYHQGDVASPCPQVTITCGVGYWSGIHLIIPSTVNMTWDTNMVSTVSLSVSGSAVTNLRISNKPSFSFQNSNKTLVITSLSFSSGDQAFINGLSVANFGAPSSGSLFGDPSSNTIVGTSKFSGNLLTVLGNPTVSSGSDQIISPPSPVTANPIMITDMVGNPGIKDVNNLRITIPAGINMIWNTAITTIVSSNTGLVANALLAYEDGSKTAVLNVVSDFGSGASVTISGLQFASIGADGISANLTVTTSGPRGSPNPGDQASDTWTKTIVGLPSINSGGTQAFTKGDPVTNANTITITESPGTPKINNTDGIRIIIPAGFNMIWDTSVGAVTVTGSAQTAGNIAAAPAVTYLPGNRTVVIPVIAPFASSQTAIISGLRFTSFANSSPLNRLGLDIDNDGVADTLDLQTIAIGAPTISTGGNQIFGVGDPPTATNTLTITDGTPARTSAANDLRIKIPAGFNMQWDTTRVDNGTGITFGGTNAAAAAGTITYETNQIARVNLSGPIGAGQTLTISGMKYQNFSNPSTPNNIQLEVNGLGTNCNVSGNFVAIGGAPSISSAANQSFTFNDPITNAASFLVTDANGFPSITMAKGVSIQIPASVPMEWNTAIVNSPPLVFGGTGLGHVTGAVTKASYSVDHKTVTILLGSDFAAGETLTIGGLQFTNFTGAHAPTNLDLFVDLAGSGVADDKTIGIGRPSILLAGAQSFGTGDPPTAINAITVTEDAIVPRIRAVNGVVIRLPAAGTLNCVFDTSVTGTAQGLAFTGTGAGHVTGATAKVSYPDNRTAVIALATDFLAGETLIVNGLTLTSFATATGPGALNLSVNASPFGICNQTGALLVIGVRPQLTGVVTADTNGNGSIDHLILTFDKTINGATTSVTAGTGFTIVSPGYTIGAGSAAGTTVTFTLVEKGTSDTDATPSILYDSTVGNLQDSGGLGLGTISTPFLSKDGAAPVAMSVSKTDTNGNGHLDTFTITFSEPLRTGMEDLADWKLIDADGTSDLLQGAVSIAIAGKTVTFTLADSFGSSGTPVFLYTPNLNGLEIQDTVAPTTNKTVQQTNASPPDVQVGGDQAVGPSKVFLDASRSTDPNGQPLTFLWTPPGGITLSDVTSPRPFFIGKAAGLYTFTVKVSNLLVSKTVSTHVTILNVPPNADPGSDQSATAGAGFFYLVAYGSSDANGDPLTFQWTQLTPAQGGGIPVTIFGANSQVADVGFPIPAPSLTIPTDNVLRFRLDVSDGVNTSSAITTIKLNRAVAIIAPTADAGPDKIVFANTPVVLDGSLSTNPSGGTLNYQWTTTLPPAEFTGATTPNPSFTPSLPGIYQFTLVVTNPDPGKFLSSKPSTTTVLVQSASNQAPVAAAHRIQPAGEISIGDLVVLDGTGSIDPEGAKISYAWVQTVGPKVIMDDPSSIRPTFTPVTPALYTFQLFVSDGVNQSLPVEVSITVKNTPGDVEYHATLNYGLGVDLAGHATGVFRLQGATTDPNPNDNYYFYLEQLSGPTAGINTAGYGGGPLGCCFSGMLSDPYIITPSGPGTYRFRLSATTTFPLLIRAYAEATVVVDQGQTVPLATAGGPATAVAGQTVTLTGSSSGTNPAFYWTQVEGPPVTLSNPNAPSPTVTPVAPGQYTFALTVSNTGIAPPPAQPMASPPAFVVMNVSPAPATASSSGGGGHGGCGFLGLEGVLLLPLVWLLSAFRSRRTSRA